MSFALRELSRLLATEEPVLGAVVAVTGATVRVATPRGGIEARALDTVAVGDRVWVRNGFITRAPVARQVFPV